MKLKKPVREDCNSNLEFEKAADFRDEIEMLQRELEEGKKSNKG